METYLNLMRLIGWMAIDLERAVADVRVNSQSEVPQTAPELMIGGELPQPATFAR
jgi:hypothetical protein